MDLEDDVSLSTVLRVGLLFGYSAAHYSADIMLPKIGFNNLELREISCDFLTV